MIKKLLLGMATNLMALGLVCSEESSFTIHWLDLENGSDISHPSGAGYSGRVGQYARGPGITYVDEILLEADPTLISGPTILNPRLQIHVSAASLGAEGMNLQLFKQNKGALAHPITYNDFGYEAWNTLIGSVQVTGTSGWVEISGSQLASLLSGWQDGSQQNWGMILSGNPFYWGYHVVIDQVKLVYEAGDSGGGGSGGGGSGGGEGAVLCTGMTPWQSGGVYNIWDDATQSYIGTSVHHNGSGYQCKSDAYGQHCNTREPGITLGWDEGWILLGTCSIGNGSIVDFSKGIKDAVLYTAGGNAEFRLDELGNVVTIENISGVGRVVGSDLEFYLTDYLGSYRTSVNRTGLRVGDLMEYFPYGRQEVVSVQNANHVTETFTQKELDVMDPGRDGDGEGLYYFGARYYDPDIALWISPDPMRQFHSPYLYTGNGFNPINATDPTGLTLGSNWNFFKQWLFGEGITNRMHDPDGAEVKEMQESPGVNRLRDKFYEGGGMDVTGFEYTTFQSIYETAWKVSDTEFQVGGFGGASAVNNGDGTVTFTVENAAGTRSFWYHIVPNRDCTDCPMRTINQTFQWTEPINIITD